MQPLHEFFQPGVFPQKKTSQSKSSQVVKSQEAPSQTEIVFKPQFADLFHFTVLTPRLMNIYKLHRSWLKKLPRTDATVHDGHILRKKQMQARNTISPQSHIRNLQLGLKLPFVILAFCLLGTNWFLANGQGQLPGFLCLSSEIREMAQSVYQQS
uniref:Uncharacterized protein n=1 Tax=Micrurus lemniscatus lemniscatus TaxID=129467 RepID=A0A2D4JTL6_MICLE